jgi:hypothetical protein
LVRQVTSKKLTLQLATGETPDTIIVSADVHNVIEDNVDVLYRLTGKGASTSQAPESTVGVPSYDQLARVFGVSNYFVVDATYNGGDVGGTASNQWVSANKLLLCKMGSRMIAPNGVHQNPGLLCPLYAQLGALSNPLVNAGNLPNGADTPFPFYSRLTYDGDIAGGGAYNVFTEASVAFKIIEPRYGFLFHGAIA